MNKNIIVVISLLCSFLHANMLYAATHAVNQKPGSAGASIAAPGKQALKASYMKLPLSFIKNEGQKDKSILFYEQGSGHATFFTKNGIVHSLGSGHDNMITLTPLNASPFTVEALDMQRGKINYFSGNDQKNWKTNIPTYGAILYKSIYPGIDMKVYGTNNQMEYDLIVGPGADPNKIRLSCTGAKDLSITKEGDLAIALKEGSILQKKPVIYQTINNKRKNIKGRFVLADASTYRFEVGSYDRKHPLVIDPVLAYSTYLGGASADYAWAIAVDSSGNAYVAGQTYSNHFPTQTPYQGASAGIAAFVTKFNPSGGALVYSTYLGGSDGDIARAIAVDSSGNAYVAGLTKSTNFPTNSPYQGANAGNWDAFLTKLNSSGNELVYSTYLGGLSDDNAYAIAVDSSGNVYVAGNTTSTDFPTQSPFQAANAGGTGDAFVTVFNPSGSALVYSTYLGGDSGDSATGIAIDSSGNAYVAGNTSSTNFPTQSPYQGTRAGSSDGFVTKLNPSGSALVYSTYLGGENNDYANAIAVDSSGSAYVAGITYSANFPVQSPSQGTFAGVNFDAFVTKFNASGSALVYSTFLGGSSDDYANAIAVDYSGSAYVAGYTYSTDFPTQSPYQETHAGGMYDVFVTKYNPSGSALVYSTYLGGTSYEYAYAIAVDSSGNAYVAGYTSSTDFPTRNPYQGTKAGSSDTFVTKFHAFPTLKSDVNKDGISDIFLKNTASGQTVLWFMNDDGTVKSEKTLFTAANSAIVGTGDFNNDGICDLLKRDAATGQTVVWFMKADGGRASYKTLFTAVNSTIVGTGDFNGDGICDLLKRDSVSGQTVLWFMNADGTRASYKVLFTDVNSTIVGTGDFNNDGICDLLKRNAATGQTVLWFMNDDGSRAGYKILFTAVNSTVVGTGDFNGDGICDLIKRDSATGQSVLWFMNADGSRASYKVLFTAVNATVAVTGDFNNDGTCDLLKRDTVTGQTVLWFMNADGTRASYKILFSDTNWTIVP